MIQPALGVKLGTSLNRTKVELKFRVYVIGGMNPNAFESD